MRGTLCARTPTMSSLQTHAHTQCARHVTTQLRQYQRCFACPLLTRRASCARLCWMGISAWIWNLAVFGFGISDRFDGCDPQHVEEGRAAQGTSGGATAAAPGHKRQPHGRDQLGVSADRDHVFLLTALPPLLSFCLSVCLSVSLFLFLPPFFICLLTTCLRCEQGEGELPRKR